MGIRRSTVKNKKSKPSIGANATKREEVVRRAWKSEQRAPRRRQP